MPLISLWPALHVWHWPLLSPQQFVAWMKELPWQMSKRRQWSALRLLWSAAETLTAHQITAV